jgi:hypothetical protein
VHTGNGPELIIDGASEAYTLMKLEPLSLGQRLT